MSLFGSLAGGDDFQLPTKIKATKPKLKKEIKLDRPRDFICCLSCNKDTYKPGGKVRVRGILLNSITGEPDVIYKLFEKEKNKVSIFARIVGPSGSVVVNETRLRTPYNSVISFDWEIPREQAGGEYEVVVSCRSNHRGCYPYFPETKRVFNVQVYRPPRFKMDLEFVRKAYGEGDKCRAVLKVVRAEGGYPENAAVVATCRLDGDEIYRGNYAVDKTNGICNISFDLPKEIKEGIGSLTCAVTEGTTESKSKTLPIILKKIKCDLYPEGGQLVQGLLCGCYFETFNTSGDPAELWGKLMKEEIETGHKIEIMEVKTFHEGRGVFTFTPEADSRYHIRVEKPSGIVYPIELPEIQKSGISLVLKNKRTVNGKKVEFLVGSDKKRTVRMAVFRKDVLIGTRKIIELEAGKMKKVDFQTGKYDGVLRATVFFEKRRILPLAERLFMVHPKDEIIYEITKSKPEYRPGEKCNLLITPILKSTGKSVKSYMSVCVTDDSVMKITERRKRPPRLFSQYYLEPEVKEVNDHQRYISPQVFDTPKDKSIYPFICTDLLLGVQGWRRYVYDCYEHYLDNPRNYNNSLSLEENLLNLNLNHFKVLGANRERGRVIQESLPDVIAEPVNDELLFPNGRNRMKFEANIKWKCLKLEVIDQEKFEFSVKIHSLVHNQNSLGLMIGVCKNEGCVEEKHLGHNKSGWAYASNGMISNSFSYDGNVSKLKVLKKEKKNKKLKEQIEKPYGDVFRSGDFITCVLNHKKKTLEFKKNNVTQGVAFKNLRARIGSLYISIAVCAQSCDLELINEELTTEMIVQNEIPNINRVRGRVRGRGRIKRGGLRQLKRDLFFEDEDEELEPLEILAKEIPKSSISRSFKPIVRPVMKMKKPRKLKLGSLKSQPAHKMKMKREMKVEQEPLLYEELDFEKKSQPMILEIFDEEKPKRTMKRSMKRKKPVTDDEDSESDDEDYSTSDYTSDDTSSSEEVFELPPEVVLPYSVIYYHKLKDRKPGAERNDFEETLLWNPILTTKRKKLKNQLELSFNLCDSVSSFRVLIDGFTRDGVLGQQYDQVINVVKPFYVEPKIPLEICYKDVVKIPIACINNMDKAITATLNLDTDFSKIFLSLKKLDVKIPGRKRVVKFVTLKVKNPVVSDEIPFVVDAKVKKYKIEDTVKKEICVKGYGFPQYWSFSGMFAGDHQKEEFSFKIPFNLITGTLQTYSFCSPSPAANMTQAMKGLIRSPCGCFEQVSSTLFPMVMASIYFSEMGVALGVSELQKLEKFIGKGFRKLKGYQVWSGACDWYGKSPGNESLTAMGINLFCQLKRVWPVNRSVIERAVSWLLKRKKSDNTGFLSHSGKYGYGFAPYDTTNAYIIWAISNCSEYVRYQQVEKIVDHYIKKVESLFRTPDFYVMALLCLSLFNFDKKAFSMKIAKEIVKHQNEEFFWKGKSSICRSWGESVHIETTSLCAMALMNFTEKEFQQPVINAMNWIMKKNSNGCFGTTQSTSLAIQAIVKSYMFIKDEVEGGDEHIKLGLNNVSLEKIMIPSKANESLFFKGFSKSVILRELENKMVVETNLTRKLPFSINIACKVAKPIGDYSKLDFTFSNKLAHQKIKEGDSTEIEVEITNKKDEGLPMIIAIIALPSGLEVRVPKLKELKKQDVFEFYELFGARKVVFYWRGMKPKATIKFKFDAIAQIPGKYTSDCSTCYLYYNDDLKYYENALDIEILPR